MYNITEIYHMIGEKELCQTHLQQAIKLVSISKDKNLAYLFNRFLSIFYLENLDYQKSRAAIQEAISIAEFTKIPDRVALGKAMQKVIDSIFTHDRNHDTDNLLTADYEINDEFLPIFYTISSIYFLINGEIENYHMSLQKGINVSDLVGDFYGSRLVEVAKALGLYLEREYKDLERFLKSIPPPNTPVAFYNDVITSLQECLNHINTGERLKINDRISEFRKEGGLSTLIVQMVYLMADYLKDNNREKFELAINIIRKGGLTTNIGIPGEDSNGKR
jgi:tetratricopeptide (TPR) repeat protein